MTGREPVVRAGSVAAWVGIAPELDAIVCAIFAAVTAAVAVGVDLAQGDFGRGTAAGAAGIELQGGQVGCSHAERAGHLIAAQVVQTLAGDAELPPAAARTGAEDDGTCRRGGRGKAGHGGRRRAGGERAKRYGHEAHLHLQPPVVVYGAAPGKHLDGIDTQDGVGRTAPGEGRTDGGGHGGVGARGRGVAGGPLGRRCGGGQRVGQRVVKDRLRVHRRRGDKGRLVRKEEGRDVVHHHAQLGPGAGGEPDKHPRKGDLWPAAIVKPAETAGGDPGVAAAAGDDLLDDGRRRAERDDHARGGGGEDVEVGRQGQGAGESAGENAGGIAGGEACLGGHGRRSGLRYGEQQGCQQPGEDGTGRHSSRHSPENTPAGAKNFS